MPASLTQRTSIGFIWLIIQTVSMRTIRMGGQIVLAYLLLPEDFGLWGMTMSVLVLALAPTERSLREVLVKRHRRFRTWATPGLWLSVMQGLFFASAMFFCAPLIADLYDEPELVGLVRIASLVPLLGSVRTVPFAKLHSAMRFDVLAMVNTTTTAVTMGLAVVLAMFDCGAYSFIVPMPISGAVGLIMLLHFSGYRVEWRLRAKRWKYLLRDTSSRFTMILMGTFSGRSDVMAMSVFLAKHEVGVYVFAFNLSMQTMGVLITSLTNVLLPALSKLEKEPQRQRTAFLRAAQMVCLLGLSTSFLQCVLAEPLIRLVFQPQWLQSVLVLQVLSVGMAMRVSAGPSGALLAAQGRFTTQLKFEVVRTPIALLAALGAATTESIVNVALAVAAINAVFPVILCYISLQRYGSPLRDVVAIYRPALMTAAVGAIPAFALSTWLTLHGHPAWLNAVASLVVMVVLCVPTARLVAPDSSRELVQRLRSLRNRRRNRREPVDADLQIEA